MKNPPKLEVLKAPPRRFSYLVPIVVGCAAAAFVLLVTGCAAGGIPGDPSKMTAEQIKQFVKDKNANVACAVLNSPYGRGVYTYVVLDKGIVVDGQIVVDSECKVTISNTTPSKAAAAASEPR